MQANGNGFAGNDLTGKAIGDEGSSSITSNVQHGKNPGLQWVFSTEI